MDALNCYTDNMQNAEKWKLTERVLDPDCHFYISMQHDEKPYCTNCYMRDFGPRGESK